jgi:ESCRT-II complex subunit VPS36
LIPLAAQMWTCHVCGFNNPMATGIKCTLCGIPRSAGASQLTSQSGTPSASTPSSRPSSPAIINRSDSMALNACPACTYLNHPSMLRCELCDTALATSSPANKQASTATQLVTDLDRQPGTVSPTFAKLSFRKGGDKQFYTALKTALQAKEWDVASSAKRASHHGSNDPTTSSQTFGISGS